LTRRWWILGLLGVVLGAVLSWHLPASAYGIRADVFNLGNLDFSHRIGRIQMQIAARAAGPASTKVQPVPTAARPYASAAEEFARSYPADHREEAAQVFAALLQKYGDIERRFRIAPGDLGGALAAFVAGNLMAIRQQPLPDAHFSALVHQMRLAVRRQPAYAQIDAIELRRTYEQLAIVGMFVAATQTGLEARPDPELRRRMEASARAYLGLLLPGQVERLQITELGLTLQ
jgi:hypothetical protein